MNWIEYRALFELAQKGSVTLNETLKGSTEIKFLLDPLGVLRVEGNKLVVNSGYQQLFSRKFEKNYHLFADFLLVNDLWKPYNRFEESDILILMDIKRKMDSGELESLRQQIIDYDESLKNISLMFFKNEKYLRGKKSLIGALEKILQVTSFSDEKDQQYMYKLECQRPQLIVLCENLDFLTKPNKPRKFGVELWYAGGKNINKLQYSDVRGLPTYYSCDWDYDGLFVIYPLVKKWLPTIQLLKPNGVPRSIVSSEHKSLWQQKSLEQYTGLFNEDEQKLIAQLIHSDSWIIEESNQLVEMLPIDLNKMNL
jgi:hypothetical protein